MANEQLLNSILKEKKRLLRELRDSEYRRGFVEAHTKDTCAFQLRVLRKERGWEQRDVAERLGNRNLQPMISRYENPDYGRYSISTLIELAAVFDVALVVRFAPFSELIEWDWCSDERRLSPKSFEGDSRLAEIETELKEEERIVRERDLGQAATIQSDTDTKANAVQSAPEGKPDSMGTSPRAAIYKFEDYLRSKTPEPNVKELSKAPKKLGKPSVEDIA